MFQQSSTLYLYYVPIIRCLQRIQTTYQRYLTGKISDSHPLIQPLQSKFRPHPIGRMDVNIGVLIGAYITILTEINIYMNMHVIEQYVTTINNR